MSKTVKQALTMTGMTLVILAILIGAILLFNV